MIAYVREENFLCTRRKFGFNKKTRTKLTFPPQQKKYHNHTTVLYTKYVHNTKNYFPPEPKKLTQHHNCMVHSKYIVEYVQPKPISRQNKKLTQQHNCNKGSTSPREASVFVPLSVHPSVRAKRGIE
jgi:hypothetical protein